MQIITTLAKIKTEFFLNFFFFLAVLYFTVRLSRKMPLLIQKDTLRKVTQDTFNPASVYQFEINVEGW